MKLFLKSADVPEELRKGMKEIAVVYGLNKKQEAGITFRKETKEGFKVTQNGNEITIDYNRKTDAFRALGRLLGEKQNPHKHVLLQEKALISKIGIMIDCSRNAVPNIEYLKEFIRKSALAGYNALTLYTEDTYEVKGEPYFGYLRGRYTYKELKDLDDYADYFGMEMFPCIQTLSHVDQALKWSVYKNVRDTAGILLAEDKATYTLIDKMISSASKPFRSKRIHVGMDEANGLGTGRYKNKHPNTDKFTIFNEHLKKVIGICKKYGLSPMIWADMYFRFESKSNDYYDPDAHIPARDAKKIPRDVTMIYWDYYHDTSEYYAEWIEKYRKLGFDPIVSPSAFTELGFWAYLPGAFATIEPCMKACIDNNVKEVLMTMWGGDGGTATFDSSFPALQACAEYAWTGKLNRTVLKQSFEAITGYSFDDFFTTCKLQSPQLNRHSELLINTLLWDDPVLGMFQDSFLLKKPSLDKHYKKLSEQLSSTGNNKILELPAQMAKVLSLKLSLRKSIMTAYRQKDKRKMAKLVQQTSRLRTELEKLRRKNKEMWFRQNKPFGWEVLDSWYGGTIFRTDSLKDALSDFAKGKTISIPEFEEKRLSVDNGLTRIRHRTVFSPSLNI